MSSADAGTGQACQCHAVAWQRGLYVTRPVLRATHVACPHHPWCDGGHTVKRATPHAAPSRQPTRLRPPRHACAAACMVQVLGDVIVLIIGMRSPPWCAPPPAPRTDSRRRCWAAWWTAAYRWPSAGRCWATLCACWQERTSRYAVCGVPCCPLEVGCDAAVMRRMQH